MNLEYIINWDDLSFDFRQGVTKQLREILLDKISQAETAPGSEIKLENYLDEKIEMLINSFKAHGEINADLW